MRSAALRCIAASKPSSTKLCRTRSTLRTAKRFDSMKLARMQDIGGLRAVVDSVARLRKLEVAYRAAGPKFKHVLVGSKNYVDEPKSDGYRSIHLIYRYRNERAPAYDGLSLELQLRTRLQHAWATAVETMGTFLGQALKAGQGEEQWRGFFAVASAALALEEGTTAVPGFEGCSATQVCRELFRLERSLRVLDKLRGFAIAADQITTERGKGAYHLVVLDSAKRSVTITPFPIARLDEANRAYAEIEKRTKSGDVVEAVLVSAGPIELLRKAYPNYFLDTHAFVSRVEKLIASSRRRSVRSKPRRVSVPTPSKQMSIPGLE
jgi:hypothetical protein